MDWSKARARGARWLEEVEQVDEEMCRVLASSVSQQAHWCAEVLRRPLPDAKDKSLQDGLRAYAAEHIDREETILRLWGEKWKAVRLLAAPLIAGKIPDDADTRVYKGLMEVMEVDMPEEEDEEDAFEMTLAGCP